MGRDIYILIALSWFDYCSHFAFYEMSNLPRYDGSTPEENDYGHMNDNNEKKDANYLPSEGVYVGADGDGPREEETIRALKPRQISMIAIGGAIGTGLVIASGRSLARSGPGSLFLSYVVMGIVWVLSYQVENKDW